MQQSSLLDRSSSCLSLTAQSRNSSPAPVSPCHSAQHLSLFRWMRLCGPRLRNIAEPLRSLVEQAGDIGHQRGALLGVCETSNEKDQHKRLRRKNDSSIVMNLGDFAGLVCHACAWG